MIMQNGADYGAEKFGMVPILVPAGPPRICNICRDLPRVGSEVRLSRSKTYRRKFATGRELRDLTAIKKGDYVNTQPPYI